MEKKSTIWVVVTWDNDEARLTSKVSVKTEQEAKENVKSWYENTLGEYNNDDDGYYAPGTLDDDCLYACINNHGRYESCEAFEVEI